MSHHKNESIKQQECHFSMVNQENPECQLSKEKQKAGDNNNDNNAKEYC